MTRAELATFVVALVVPAASARAGNDDGILIGNEAALSGGAVTATTSDGSALWYNPAGFAEADVDTLDVSGSAFVLRHYRAPRFLVSTSGEASDGEVLELLSVPSGLSYVRPIGRDARVAYGIFTTRSLALAIRGDMELARGAVTSSWLLDFTVKQQDYRAGGGFAWRLAPGLCLGVSLFGVYEARAASTQLAGGAVAADGSPLGFLGESTRIDVAVLGVEAAIGVQWQLHPRWRLGLAVRTPLGVFFTDASVHGTVTTDLGAEPFFAPLRIDETRWGLDLVAPARVRLGLAYTVADGWIALDVDVQHALRDETSNTDRDAVYNARLGGRFELAPGLAFGAGLFTDHDAAPRPSGFASSAVDFRGATLGLEWHDAHALAPGAAADRLTFTTALALRYAYGAGRVGGLRVAPIDDGVVDVVGDRTVDLTVHEVSLHLGSSLRF